jgi:hypothetical protein
MKLPSLKNPHEYEIEKDYDFKIGGEICRKRYFITAYQNVDNLTTKKYTAL